MLADSKNYVKSLENFLSALKTLNQATDKSTQKDAINGLIFLSKKLKEFPPIPIDKREQYIKVLEDCDHKDAKKIIDFLNSIPEKK
ncbi:hypothetical protein Barb4_03044 [Bacteroidales bacterium Barb4]|nr:hypothetical protein Barb4_03044 [Bacteroidales bacterium Barb4]